MSAWGDAFDVQLEIWLEEKERLQTRIEELEARVRELEGKE